MWKTSMRRRKSCNDFEQPSSSSTSDGRKESKLSEGQKQSLSNATKEPIVGSSVKAPSASSASNKDCANYAQPIIIRPEPINKAWTNLTEKIIHRSIRTLNVKLATTAATHPRKCITLITLLSFGLVVAGFLTNFELIFGHSELFTPIGSRPKAHTEWIENESNFPVTSDFVFIVHSDGESVMNREAIRRLFYALDTILDHPGYENMCSQSDYRNFDDQPDCWIWSATNFWNHKVTEFEATTKTDDDLVRTLSQPYFQDGTPVFKEAMFGKYKAVNETLVYNAVANQIFHYPHEHDYLTYIPNYFVTIGMPYVDDTWTFQETLLEKFMLLKEEWRKQAGSGENPNNIQLDFFCGYSYELEYARALTRDFPLIPVVFFVMLGFTCFVFHRYGSMQEGAPTRATIGMASVVTVGMSMMSGFGIMFCFGVPFTNITLMAPFIILGVGLDDTFIITGAYFRRLKEDIQDQTSKSNSASNQSNNSSPLSKEYLLSGFDSGDSRVSDSDGGGQDTSSNSPLEQLYDHSAIVERIRLTMEEVGLSISLTTITTTTAFVLGCLSTIPGIRWLCLYASVTIVLDSVYQVTYFVALLTLDERRVVLAQAKAMVKQQLSEAPKRSSSFASNCSDCYSWLSNALSHAWVLDACRQMFPQQEISDRPPSSSGAEESVEESNACSPIFVERFMTWYACTLLKPRVRETVIFFCLALFGACLYSTTQLTQKFDPQDYVPDDSYIQDFFSSLDDYAALTITFEVYFRNVDQSDPVIQQQMRDYVLELSRLPEIGMEPEPCWVTDMEGFLGGNFSATKVAKLPEDQARQAAFLASALQSGNFTFEETLSLIMSVPAIRDLYGSDIVINEAGEITASRCWLHLRKLDMEDVPGQVNFLHKQQDVARSQPVNQLPENRDNWAFFAMSSFHGYWELYAVAIQELIWTTIFGVVSVCVVGFLIIPHWSAVCFVGPLIIMLYFDLLGILQFCGIYINALTYVTIVISIGLLVDFLMHILLRYYETTGATREAKVKETLETMGASMALGGFTTWLGVIPMAFSTTAIFTTIFVAFLAMVTLGLLIGLAFLPALLSICGPVVTLSTKDLGKSVETPTSPTTLGSPTSNTTKTSKDPNHHHHNPYRMLVDSDSHDSMDTTTDPGDLIPASPSWDSIGSLEEDEGEPKPIPQFCSQESDPVAPMPDEDDDEERGMVDVPTTTH